MSAAKAIRATLLAALCGPTLLAVGTFPVSAAAAETAKPHWSIESLAAPTDFSTVDNASPPSACSLGLVANSCDIYYVTATDAGAGAMKAKEVTLEDTLPAGLAVRYVGLFWAGIEAVPGHGDGENLNTGTRCTVVLPLVKCTLKSSFFSTLGHTVQPDDAIRMEIAVTVAEPATPATLANHVKVEGGEAPSTEATAANTLEEGAPPFGPALFSAPALTPEGTPSAQAGSHPYELPTHIGLASTVRETAIATIAATSAEDPRDVLVDLPPGLAGSARSTPELCTLAQLGAGGEHHVANGESACPKESQIGYLRSFPLSLGPTVKSPLYNMVPERGVAAEFGYTDIENGTHVLYVSLAPTPQGYVLRTSSREIPQVPLTQIVANIYGDPATRDGSSVATHIPTLSEPTDCSGKPLLTQIHMDSWQHPGSYEADGQPKLSEPNWATKTYEAPPVSGCSALAGLFKPKLEAHPTTTQADKPTGLEVVLRVPQSEEVGTLATPPLRKAVVTLPEGMTVNPSSANGLGACSLAQIGIDPATHVPNAAPPNCPDASKIGSVELETPALPGVLKGQIYVAKPKENPFNTLLAIYIVIDDPSTGVIVKLAGEVRADPQTGQLTTVVDNSPQFPFSELRTNFFAGQKAALRTPAVCGKYKVTSVLTPWSAPESGPAAEPAGEFEITGGCAPSAASEPNSPSFSAGTESPAAGAFSPFLLRLHREDGSQELSGLSVTLPEGLIGKLAGVGECSGAQLALARSRQREGGGQEELSSPSCPPSSEVGTVTVGAGAGLTPFYTTGKAYLAGPYKGAPLSVAIVTPAVAGPYDLGAVVVQAALRVNPETAQVSAVSDEIPHILDGIPLDVRSIALNMARPQFTLNPTNCERKAVSAQATSVLGQSVALANPFQVGGCGRLGFAPRLSLSLWGKTNRGANPAFKAVLAMAPGEANIARAAVTLPHSEFLDQAHIKTICTRVVFAEGTTPGERCPPGSIYGHAEAITPLLSSPLEGPVYLRSSDHNLPDLVAALNGQIQVVLDGTVDSVKGGIRNRFEVVPDAPVSQFTLEMQGGAKGLLQNSTNICAGRHRAVADFTAQSGRVSDTEPLLRARCPKARKGKGHHHKKHKRHGRHHRRAGR